MFINDFWNKNGFQMLQIKFYECKNNTNNNKCKSQDEINEYLSLQEISLYYIDTFVKTTQFKHPFQQGIKEVFYYVSNLYTFYLTNYIAHLEMHNDDGFFFSTNHVTDTFKVENLRELTILQKSEHNIQFSLIILKKCTIENIIKYRI